MNKEGRLLLGKALKIVTSFILIFSLTIPMYARAEYPKTDVVTYLYDVDNSTTFNCIFIDGIPVPYVSIMQFFLATNDKNYKIQPEGDGRYRFYNDKGYMIFDPDNDTIVVYALDMSFYKDCMPPDFASHTVGDANASNQYYIYEGNKFLSDVTEYELDLGKYGVDIIEDGGMIYLPLTAANILFGGSYDIPAYADGFMSITTGGDDPIVDSSINLDKMTRDISEVEYTYNNLSFLMDTVYGCPPYCSMSDIIRENGFDAAMESTDDTRMVKSLLKSTDTVDFLFGIATLSEMLYDGGHTFLVMPIFKNPEAEAVMAFEEARENPKDPRTELYEKWININLPDKQAHSEIENYIGGYDDYIPIFEEYDERGMIRFAYYEYDDTGIFVFSEFETDTISNLKRALDLAKEHGMKNFLLDESVNVGGEVGVFCYMLGLMTNRMSLYFRNVSTGDMLESVYKCDYNSDGIFGDSMEDAGYDFNYGVLCSSDSFSSGNLLPVYAKEAGIPIIGETSGGGTCMAGFFYLPNTYGTQFSSYLMSVREDGTDVDAGAKPDYDITKHAADGSIDYSNFHDFALLDNILDMHYADKTPASDRAVNGKQAFAGQTIKVSSVPKTGDDITKNTLVYQLYKGVSVINIICYQLNYNVSLAVFKNPRYIK